ncbi:MAG: hypothetical protein L6R19_26580 [Alphaproteobacteria bacterium]|nr:hypothetical protein [Alphaproteobacteria bacterium]
MATDDTLTHAQLKTPRAAAIAGIAFSFLLMASLLLLRISIPADPLDQGEWLERQSHRVVLALNLIPFAGIAFLWFVGVLRDRLGAREDRFFASVFLGSGFLFLGLLFVAAAIAGGIIAAHSIHAEAMRSTPAFSIARGMVYNLLNIYAIKMACVFMISTSTLALRTGFAARWIAVSGFVLALLLLAGSYWIKWSVMIFPVWVIAVSAHILVDNFRRSPAG